MSSPKHTGDAGIANNLVIKTEKMSSVLQNLYPLSLNPQTALATGTWDIADEINSLQHLSKIPNPKLPKRRGKTPRCRLFTFKPEKKLLKTRKTRQKKLVFMFI
jgi:hypothetical protein